jgi:hypothetical protein
MDRRPIELRLTVRHAEMMLSILRMQRKRAERALEKSTYVPPPGKFHMEYMRVLVLSGWIAELQTQFNSVIQKGNQS